MRARLALLYANTHYELREVLLQDKPDHMLAISPKGTVPVLQLQDGTVIEESLDIALWALTHNDPQHLMPCAATRDSCLALIQSNDVDFKPWLDRYKYSDRHPDHSPEHYRAQAEVFLAVLERKLAQQPFLLGESACLADICIMPFIRQFAHVDKAWFDSTGYTQLQLWLEYWLASDEFQHVMKKQPLFGHQG